ncbi:transcription accessory protein [Thalassotalea insulae]|uniref:Transcription accessory protein n=1 Tax=Thalassotalea insulae TaxID=2056778 RepID=A0ABQ6GSG3_9GAMM|nr:Tex family protein [Thalassotalea insulae]GLX78337.1 transcription accessory protein [Thalassotalea insulae]
MTTIAEQLAQELNVKTAQVNAAINLLDDGATVPFIARYRKEATQGLDDNHLRQLAQRLAYLRELNERRQVILTNIEQQGKLSVELKAQLEQADNKTRLEDLYLPYRPKRRTKGQMAIEAGLAPLADLLFSDWSVNPEQAALDYLNTELGYGDAEQVLEGVSYILIERFSEDANLLQKLRRHLKKQAHMVSRVVKKKQQEAAKYQDYFDHHELLSKVPSHRALAMLRGRNEGFLNLSIDVDPGQEASAYSSAEQIISEHFSFRFSGQAAAAFLTKVVRLAWKAKLSVSLETELLGQLRERAETEAINVFATNLKDLLMAAPAGAKVTLGLDPGLRTGCKIAIVSDTGKLLHTTTIFPHAPQNNWDKSVRTLVNLCQQHKVELIAIGNGTASRESDKLVVEVLEQLEQKSVKKVLVSEAGASVYSASELAANEFPDLDVSLRGAVSIARRLQDPLAELVKIDPKAIGVGQYQHDVSQSQLTAMLDNVIEDCVNAVGVELNSASAALLTRVSGLNKTMAQNIVRFRDEHGRFNNRKELKKVARLGPKAFEQSAGFLRIANGDNPLDQSGVHPETYPVVEKMLQALNSDIAEVMGNSDKLKQLTAQQLADEQFGVITVEDIIAELEKPGRDPRPEFKTANFKEGINTINDLQVGMILEGVVSNVANFGAFVDLGVHQDGLVHISAMTNKFISDPHDIVKAGDIVKVKVTEVEAARKRISLTMRLDDAISAKPAQQKKSFDNKKSNGKAHQPKSGQRPHKNKAKEPANAAMGNAFADALAKLKK